VYYGDGTTVPVSRKQHRLVDIAVLQTLVSYDVQIYLPFENFSVYLGYVHWQKKFVLYVKNVAPTMPINSFLDRF
jgi:hypothetical protein